MTDNEYSELAQIADEAQDRLITGEGQPGIHYLLMHVLKSKHGVSVFTREDAIKQARKLCDKHIEETA